MPEKLFKGQPSESILETQVELPLMSKGEHVVQDYASLGLSLKAHPVSVPEQPVGSVLLPLKMRRVSLTSSFFKSYLKNTERKFCMPNY